MRNHLYTALTIMMGPEIAQCKNGLHAPASDSFLVAIGNAPNRLDDSNKHH